LFVECRAPVNVLAERAAQRDQRARVSDASLSIVMRERSAWETLDELAPEAHVALRSDRPVEAQLADLLALLDQWIASIAQFRRPPSVLGRPPDR
jgi:predicted kinase